MNVQDVREAPTPGRQATAREFVSVLFRRKWIILGIFLATTLTVVTLMLATPAAYVSSGRVMIKRGEQTSSFDADRRLYSDWEQELSSELELVKSEPILDRARQRLREQARPGERAPALDAGRVDVEVMGKSNVIGIAYSDRDPAVARRVCDALIHAYLDDRQKLLGLADPRRFFETEIARVSGELARKTEARRAYQDQTGVVDINQQRVSLLAQLSNLQQEKSTVGADLAEARAGTVVMRDLMEKSDVDLPMASSIGNEFVLDLKRRVIEQEARVAQRRERYRDESPEVANASQSLQDLKSLLKREVESRLVVAGSRVQVLEKRQESLDRDIARVQAQLADMPALQARLEQLDHDISSLQSRYQDLVSKSDLARVTENTRSRVSVLLLDPAGAATPQNVRDYVRIALAPAFSLVVGIGLAFFIDGLDITVHTSTQAEEAIELPVLAALPERRRRARVAPTRSSPIA